VAKKKPSLERVWATFGYFDLLGLEMVELKDLDLDLSITGFDAREIDALLGSGADRSVSQRRADCDSPDRSKRRVLYAR